MQRVRQRLREESGARRVLVRGESGTGKTLAARVFHELGGGGPLIGVCCECATQRQLIGALDQASDGTLLLEEIGSARPELQRTVLDALDGSRIRLAATTHKNLENMVKRSLLDGALLDGLRPVVWLPPLRTRRADVPVLALHFARRASREHGAPPVVFSDDALAVLTAQPWPVNVRQLHDFVERIVLLHPDALVGAALVEREIQSVVRFAGEVTERTEQAMGRLSKGRPPADTDAEAAERRALARTLAHAHGNRLLAARLLRVAAAALDRKLAQHGLG